MIQKLIIITVVLIVSITFLMLSFTGGEKDPIVFISGSEEYLQRVLKDIPDYNNQIKRMFRIFSLIELIIAIITMFNPALGIIFLMLSISVGVLMMYFEYKEILKNNINK